MALSARALLALLEECNPDASNNRAEYGLVDRQLGCDVGFRRRATVPAVGEVPAV